MLFPYKKLDLPLFCKTKRRASTRKLEIWRAKKTSSKAACFHLQTVVASLIPCTRKLLNREIWQFWKVLEERSFSKVERTYFKCLRIKSFRILLIYFTLCWLTSNVVELFEMLLNHLKSCWMVSHHVEWFHITLNHFTSRWMVSHYVVWFHITLNGFTTRRAETAQIT